LLPLLPMLMGNQKHFVKCLMQRPWKLQIFALDASDVLRYLIGRGIERKAIFLNSRNRKDFIARLARLAFDCALVVYA
jgi:hypothetical protein